MMAMKPGVSLRARWWFIAGVAMVVLSTPAIYGCGPWFDQAVFVPGETPQTSQFGVCFRKLGNRAAHDAAILFDCGLSLFERNEAEYGAAARRDGCLEPKHGADTASVCRGASRF